MRSALVAFMILLVTALSTLAVASPGLGKADSRGEAGERSAEDRDDDDSGGDSDDDDGGGSGKKGDGGKPGKKGDGGKPGKKGDGEPGKKDDSGGSTGDDGPEKEDDADREEDGATEEPAPSSSTPDSLPRAFDPDAPITPDGSDSPSNGSSRSDSVEERSPPSPPSVGERVNVAPRGEVLVRLPASAGFVPLGGAASLPNGSLVDAREGSITLTSASDRQGATQTAMFRGAVFQIVQDKERRPVTELRLADGEEVASCELLRALRGILPPAQGSRANLRVRRYQRQGTTTTAARKRGRRGLWSNGKGRFRTRGRHGAASVRGTRWLTEDRCEGTFFTVTRGVVTVEDFGRDRTVTLGPGDSYLARRP